MANLLNFLVPKGSTVGVDRKFVRSDPQVRAFTFRMESKTAAGAFENSLITLFVNPEEFTVAEPYRVTVTQTKGGAFVDNFGYGIRTITLRGVTGYKDRDVGGTKISGQKHFLQLRDMFRTWGEKVSGDSTGKGSENNKLYFYNWQDDDYYEIVVNAFNLLRSTGRPLLYQYNINITCVRDLKSKKELPEVSADVYDWDSYIRNPEMRPPLILTKINAGLFSLDSIINNLVDKSKLSSGTQTWATYIAKGIEYYNTVNNTYETVESLISSIEDLSKDITVYVEGASSFIKTPLELVRDLAVSVDDVIDSMCAVEDIPHELIRTFREMRCAIKALTPVSFEGYTNPSLFEGASNCGTTLGIPEASVSIYDNSFSATAKVALDRTVSQYFSSPQEILVLKEEPLVVTGVFIDTDTAKSGLNYLKSYAGAEVTLTSIPAVPVVVDYKVQQTTTIDRLTLQAAQSVIVKTDDTLSRIAYNVYGDPSDWKLIALFNNIEYPYIVNSDFVTEVKATGTVRFYRGGGVTTDISIPLGHLVWVPEYMGTLQINFVTTEAKTLNIGEAYVDVSVEAADYGNIGNVAPRLITGYTTITGIVKIQNLSATRGGKIYKVAKPGDLLQIPKTEKSIQSTVSPAQPTYEQLFGIDIAISNDGEWKNIENVDTSDLALTFGTSNLVQALRNRIATRKGFYLYHLAYGTNLPYYIGKKNIPYWQELIRTDIGEACLLDPRIESINTFSMVVDGDSIEINMTAVPINETSSVDVQVVV